MTRRRDLLLGGLGALGGAGPLRSLSAQGPPRLPAGDGWASVREFGARGDGDHNDAPAFQRCVASGASIIFVPPGNYRLDEPVNLTERGARPLTVCGAGHSHHDSAQTTTLIGNTGGVVLDTVGSSYLRLEGLQVQVTESARRPSTVGILMGRSRENPFPQFHRHDDLVIFMRSMPRTGERGSVGVYNVACEHWIAAQVRSFADLPFALASRDVLGIESPHTGALAPPASLTMCGLYQTAASAFTHAGYEFWDTQNILLEQVYAQRLPSNTSGYPLRFSAGTIASLAISGQFEEWLGLADFTVGASAVDFDCLLNQAMGPYLRLARDCSLEFLNLRVKQIHGTQQSLFAAGRGSAVRASELQLMAGQSIDAAALTLVGSQVRMVERARIAVAAGSKYVTLGNDGMRQIG